MAIDTAEKRMNVVGVGRPWNRRVFPIATPDVQWKASVGMSWGANGLEIPSADWVGTFNGTISDDMISINSTALNALTEVNGTPTG